MFWLLGAVVGFMGAKGEADKIEDRSPDTPMKNVAEGTLKGGGSYLVIRAVAGERPIVNGLGTGLAAGYILGWLTKK